MSWLQSLRAEGEHATRLAGDLEFYAAQMLRIRPKAGSLAPFLFNPAQRELHRRLEEQRAKTGRVRAIVLKARQVGISTYVAARFYKATTAAPGLRTQIICHEKPASRNLFSLVKRFHDNMPAEHKQSVGANNAEELVFDSIDSGYMVSVATLEGSGRSSTAQFLHASEAAFWESLQEQLSALVQTIPDLDGTEIIIETTGNQFGDEFHQLWRRAEAGDSEFMPVFLPWSIDPTYRTRLPDDFAMTAEEKTLAELHGLDAEQIAWRRAKISQLGSEDHFEREYPLIPDEAFMASQFDSFITSDIVLAARKTRDIEAYGPLLIGVDPAGQGDDATAIAWRRGHCITKIERQHKLTTMQIAGLVQKIIRDDKPASVAIDVGGLGIGVYERLVEQGHGEIVKAVNFGGKAVEPPPLDETGKPSGGNANRRAELWNNVRTALQGRFSIPDDDALHADLTSVGYKYDSSGRLLLESKIDMKRRGMPSPDSADAVALCFSEPGGAAIPRSASLNWNRKLNYPNSGVA